ncbi:AraC family transcriptional regulator [Pseudoalteromonas ardens]|uniref:AraC family transcriptional regulator n=1 Tax=Pseudoalteromonas rubra TaxID=43658 RepID=A0A0L0ETV8_9GAMM|nr:AraC family transcriptional regulator [Pseudoalteromonas sp. R96]KNC67917.1 AraC family transcriptional regulator [Pseudoalteromonas rubra]MDK1309795.1 helix-turn-helix domain-containing protein [Pseudoalteromonas sp. R96]
MSTLIKVTPETQPWIGSSDALFSLKQQISLLAQCNLPVHIIGQPGSGKHLAVSHLHQMGKTESQPLIISCVNHWDGRCAVTQLDALISQSLRGTLYLKNIDALTNDQAEAIKDYWLNLNTNAQAPRLITSTTIQKHQQALTQTQQSSFLNWLHYHCLELSIPTLAQRREDIPALFNHYKSTCQHIAKLQLDEQAMALLTNYCWPHNAKQLKRCLDKLSFLSHQQEITKPTLVKIFPAMNDAQNQYSETLEPVSAKQVNDEFSALIQSLTACEDPHEFESQHTDSDLYPAPVIQLQAASKPHPALARALEYIDENFKKPLSLSEVASYACVSPSHLSFLFKRYVGQSFKQTLLRIRIKTAMALLREDPYSQVTEVCDDVGFSDLSFFVRKFKSVVGVSPGVYRDQRTKH